MITRIWHGTTSLEKSHQYLEFLLNKGTNDYRLTPGNRSVRIWKKTENDACHFWTVTEWDNQEALKSFAGEDYGKAVYYPADKNFLLDFEENVNHYECYDTSVSKINDYIRQIKLNYIGGSWQGESFLEKLEMFDEYTAFIRPVEGIHSGSEILWHCLYWRKVVINAILGDSGYRDRTKDVLNFRDLNDLKLMGWETLKDEFIKAEQTLVELLYKQNDSFLKTEYLPGYTFDYLLEGIIQHDIYHLGQMGLIIAILKKRQVIAAKKDTVQ
jgi:hypothetical protein